jgi:hypothetical protein
MLQTKIDVLSLAKGIEKGRANYIRLITIDFIFTSHKLSKFKTEFNFNWELIIRKNYFIF